MMDEAEFPFDIKNEDHYNQLKKEVTMAKKKKAKKKKAKKKTKKRKSRK
jgi:hypothetical protein